MQKKSLSFKSVKPTPVGVEARDPVRMRPLRNDGALPLLIEPEADDIDLFAWARENQSLLQQRVLEHGGILFRGFNLGSVELFEEFARILCRELFNENGEHPRESVSGEVYTPVFFPPRKQLLWHNENSFNHRWPGKILFCCVKPAETGGETPVVDSREVFRRLDPKLREPFVEKGVMYVRNYGTGAGLDWQTVFQTSDRAEVEERCRANRMQLEWKPGNLLRTSCVRPAVVPHAETGELCWFNQAQHWHVACLDDETRESVQALFGEADLPRSCYYGDGTPIEDSVMHEILAVYRELEVCFPWQAGDVIALDNVLAAHGRNAFTGERKLLVALGDMGEFAQA